MTVCWKSGFFVMFTGLRQQIGWNDEVERKRVLSSRFKNSRVGNLQPLLN